MTDIEKKQMKISEIVITPIRPINGLVAFASLIYDKAFYVGSLGIWTRPEGGYRITYPKRKMGETNISIFYPINKEVGILMEQMIVKAYEEMMEASVKELYGDQENN